MKHITVHSRLLMVCVLFLAVLPEIRGQSFNPWPEITAEMKPWTRWWWMGSAVDEQNIGFLLGEYYRKGFGGVEITPIYGTKGAEDRYIPFLSEHWMQVLHYTCAIADSLGMGVDINNGTGWPFGGPQVSPEHAASKLLLQTYSVTSGKAFPEKIRPPDKGGEGAVLQALVAGSDTGGRMDLAAEVTPDGSLQRVFPEGEWTLTAAFCGKTMQKVKRAAPGGEGYTLDHLSADALDHYLARFDSAFESHVPRIRCLFNDSYEVYNASWTPSFFPQFEEHRNYDLRQFIPELAGDGEHETIARVKYDYRLTMSEMLLANFTENWTRWAHKYGMKTRNQAHGSPANLLDLYSAVDIPEIETFGSSSFSIPGFRSDTPFVRDADHDPLFLRLAASAAHVSGKRLVSCETFTWLGEHFRVSLARCKPEVEQAFLAGVNHVFFHGTTYSPRDASWPGWLFYASVNFAPSNSFWPHIEGLNRYIARCQSILQKGSPDNDLLVYWPIHDQWQQADKLEKMVTVHEGRKWLDLPQVRTLMASGYTFDFISDRQIGQMVSAEDNLIAAQGGSLYKALYVPSCRYMPLETLQEIMELADSGACIIFGQLPEGVPGLAQQERQNQTFRQILDSLHFMPAGDGMLLAKRNRGRIVSGTDVVNVLERLDIQRESLGDKGLRFIRRRSEDGLYFYLVNHTSQPVDTFIPLNCMAETFLWMDPMTGEWGRIPWRTADRYAWVKVHLLPGQSGFVFAGNQAHSGIPEWPFYHKSGREIQVNGPWTLDFLSGGPVPLPRTEMPQAVPWTSLDRDEVNCFSGTAGYSTRFIMQERDTGEYLLIPGEVYESARIWINGKDAGILWSIPFQLRVGDYLHPGINTLRIEVANLMANRVRDMDKKGMEWKIFRDINIVSLAYKPFSAAGWSVLPSGLRGPVILVPLDYDRGDE